MTLQTQPPTDGRYTYKTVQYVRTVDGDTCILRFALPFHHWHETDVRLIGINTPELRDPDPMVRTAAQAAKQYLADLLARCPIVAAQSSKSDKYGRWLAEVWVLCDREVANLNQLMLDSGHATPYAG